jgi:aspartyl protease family protein
MSKPSQFTSRKSLRRLSTRILGVCTSTFVFLVLQVGLTWANSTAMGERLQQAVNRQDWVQAIRIVDQLIIAEPQRATQLRQYRNQLVQLQRAGVKVVPSSASSSSTTSASSTLVGQVPIKRRSGGGGRGVPIIDVKFNRRLTFEMMVDSGASMTVITRQMARSMGLSSADVIDQVTFSTANGTVAKPIVLVNSIEFGGVGGTMMPVAIASDMDVGLLGQDFLEKFDVTIRRDTIEFHRRR